MDSIAGITAYWGPRLGLNGAGYDVTARVLVLARFVLTRRTQVLEELGLSPGEFDVLASVAHMCSFDGSEGGVNLAVLADAALVTSGAITKRIDRLEKAGMVERLPDLNDRRGTLVKLTGEGRRVVDEAVRRVVEAEDELVTEHLGADDRGRLLEPLKDLVSALDQDGA